MAYEVPGFKLGTRIAGADLSAKQFHLVKLSADGKVALAGDGELSFPLQGTPIADESADVMISGVSKVVSGAAVAEGAILACDAAGKAITAVTGKEGLGLALSAAAGADEIIPVLLIQLGVQA